jgi:hypothetical protein
MIPVDMMPFLKNDPPPPPTVEARVPAILNGIQRP